MSLLVTIIPSPRPLAVLATATYVFRFLLQPPLVTSTVTAAFSFAEFIVF